MPIPKLLRDLLTLPTAPFAELAVLDYVESACSRLPGVTLRRDQAGNLLATYQNGRANRRPLVFTAHTDHPGFVALEMIDRNTLRAAFRGWVEPEYFRNEKVRFWNGRRSVPGKVVEILKSAPVYGFIGRTGRPEEVAIRVPAEIAPGSPGMWDLPDPALRGDLLSARGCDDVAGSAAMLALLDRLSRKQASAEVHCLFTRAEEVGFIGAIAAARTETISKDLPIIAIETSKALPGAPIGDGPILRVGDKSSIFTPALTHFCDRVARQLAAKRKTFAYQRKLMDGGTCESTAYLAYGYQATGICVALGNYHNMDTQRRKIASEQISLSDWKRMVDWFEALVLDESGYTGATDELREAMEKRYEGFRALLK